jgi:hypothetical protein
VEWFSDLRAVVWELFSITHILNSQSEEKWRGMVFLFTLMLKIAEFVTVTGSLENVRSKNYLINHRDETKGKKFY